MRKKILSLALIVSMILSVNIALSINVSAEEYEEAGLWLTYETENGEITITRCINSPTVLKIPASINGIPVTKIGRSAFGDSNMTSIIIPDGVKSIGERAFAYCWRLNNITIPDSVISIGVHAFHECDALTDVYYTGTKEEWSEFELKYSGNSALENATVHFIKSEGAFNYSVIDGEAIITSCDKNLIDEDVEIPDEIGGYTVTEIKRSAFQDCRNVTSITIPEGVRSIDVGAFSRCYNLTDINVSENNRYFASNDGVLFNKPKTILYKYPSGKADESYTVPNSVSTIYKEAFSNSYTLTSVTIPGSVKSINEGAFIECMSLTDLTISYGVTYIGEYAFENCWELTSLVIPDSVEHIDEGAFYACEGLTSVTIGSGVKIIEWDVFRDCDNITDVYYNGTEEEWGNIEMEDDDFARAATLHFLKAPVTPEESDQPISVDDVPFGNLSSAMAEAKNGSFIEILRSYDASGINAILHSNVVMDIKEDKNLKNAYVTATNGAYVKMGETKITGKNIYFNAEGKLDIAVDRNAKLKTALNGKSEQSFLWTVNSANLPGVIKFIINSDDDYNGKAYDYAYGDKFDYIEGDIRFGLTFSGVPENIEIEIAE